MSTETVGLTGTGAQDDHLDFHTPPELCVCIVSGSSQCVYPCMQPLKPEIMMSGPDKVDG